MVAVLVFLKHVSFWKAVFASRFDHEPSVNANNNGEFIHAIEPFIAAIIREPDIALGPIVHCPPPLEHQLVNCAQLLLEVLLDGCVGKTGTVRVWWEAHAKDALCPTFLGFLHDGLGHEQPRGGSSGCFCLSPMPGKTQAPPEERNENEGEIKTSSGP